MDHELTYTVGNGKMCAVLRYGNVLQAFGPPYSSPSLFSSSFSGTFTPSAPRHADRAAIWSVDLTDAKGQTATVTDMAVAGKACLVRHFVTKRPLNVTLEPLGSGQLDYMTRLDAHTFLIKSRNGNPIYNDYPLYFPQFYLIHVRGNAGFAATERGHFEVCVTGEAELMMFGGPDEPAAWDCYQSLKDVPWSELYRATLDWWHGLFEKITFRVPADAPARNQLLSAIEDTVLCIITQQDESGGVLAGYNYHLGYVRDQFGVCMLLLRLGLYDRARLMLEFYAENFRRDGKVLNAQAMGVPGIFHFAENDNVEITGYLLLQFFRYADASGDTAFLEQCRSFLAWLCDRQVREERNDTLPFNGDETYIAGGLLPRDVVSDGSAEATALFLLSGTRYADFAEKHGEDVSALRERLARVKQQYARHFIYEGKYSINDPSHYDGYPLPTFRYGVCMNPDCHGFGWTTLTEKTHIYLCPHCMESGFDREKETRRYFLPSALLMPAYLGFDFEELRPLVTAELLSLTERLDRDGHFYSMPDERVNVGYDYGLLLFGLHAYGLPGAEKAAAKLLSLRDGAGVWAEYYQEDRPFNTRYRPWESAINLDALLAASQETATH